MSAGLIPSNDSFATGDPASAFFLRATEPIATPSPLQIISPDGGSVTAVNVGNSGVTTVTTDGNISIFANVSAASLSSTSAITGVSINADISTNRIYFVSSTAGSTTITQAIPGLTTIGVVFVQQVSSGAPVTPVVTQCLAGSIVLTAAAPMAANTDYLLYVARF
jgi:hypothetical protein